MLVHPDRAMEGKNELELKDVNGRPIIQGLIHTATALPDKPAGWYHYEWPVRADCFLAGRAATSGWSRLPTAGGSSSAAACTTTGWSGPSSWTS